MNKKIILGILAVVVVGSLVVAGTRAYFSQEGNVLSNTFSTGTLALKLNGAETATAAWQIDTGAPGDLVSGTVNIKNTGNIVADHIEVTAENTVTESDVAPGSTAGVALDTVLEIMVLTYDGVSVLDQVTDANGNEIKDLDDLETGGLDGLALRDLNVDHLLAMTIRFNPSLTVAEHQGDSAATTLTVTLNQDSSQ